MHLADYDKEGPRLRLAGVRLYYAVALLTLYWKIDSREINLLPPSFGDAVADADNEFVETSAVEDGDVAANDNKLNNLVTLASMPTVWHSKVISAVLVV